MDLSGTRSNAPARRIHGDRWLAKDSLFAGFLCELLHFCEINPYIYIYNLTQLLVG